MSRAKIPVSKAGLDRLTRVWLKVRRGITQGTIPIERVREALIAFSKGPKVDPNLRAIRQAANKIKDAYLRSQAFGTIAAVSHEASDFSAACQAAAGIKDTYLRRLAFSAIVEELAKAGDLT